LQVQWFAQGGVKQPDIAHASADATFGQPHFVDGNNDGAV
jgi:hypothetical protein